MIRTPIYQRSHTWQQQNSRLYLRIHIVSQCRSSYQHILGLRNLGFFSKTPHLPMNPNGLVPTQTLKDKDSSAAFFNLLNEKAKIKPEKPFPTRHYFPNRKKMLKIVDEDTLSTLSPLDLLKAGWARDFKSMWTIYRNQMTDMSKYHPEDHASMLAVTSTYSKTIFGAVHASMVKVMMRKQGIPLDARDYVFLMTTHLRNNNDLARVLEVFQEAKTIDKIQPTIKMYCLLMKSLGKAKQLRFCLDVYQEMLLSTGAFTNVQLSVLNENQNISDYYLDPKLIQLETKRFSGIYDLDSRAILIETYARCGHLQEAKVLFEDYVCNIKNSKFKYGEDVWIYNAMIKAYGMAGHKNEALDLFDRITNPYSKDAILDIKPTLKTFDSLLDVHLNCQSSPLEAMAVWSECISFCVSKTREMLTSQGRRAASKHISIKHYSLPNWKKSASALISFPTKVRESHIPHGYRLFPLPSSYLKMMKIMVNHSGSTSHGMKLHPWQQVLRFFFACRKIHVPLETKYYEQVILACAKDGKLMLATEWYHHCKELKYVFSPEVQQIMND